LISVSPEEDELELGKFSTLLSPNLRVDLDVFLDTCRKFDKWGTCDPSEVFRALRVSSSLKKSMMNS
jgi:hypothetical protein